MIASDINNPIWKELILGDKLIKLNFLAANILLSRLKMDIKYDKSKISSSVHELFNLYLNNQQLPSVKKDILNILGHA